MSKIIDGKMSEKNKMTKMEILKEVWEKFSVLIGVLSSISLIFFYNPSGYSYVHWIIKLPWEFTTEYVLIGLFGIILLTPTFLDFPSAWKAAGFKGKALFFIYLVVVGLLMYTTGLYENWHYDVWVAEIAIVAFMLWGAFVNYRDRKKYSVYGTEEQGTQEVELT